MICRYYANFYRKIDIYLNDFMHGLVLNNLGWPLQKLKIQITYLSQGFKVSSFTYV